MTPIEKSSRALEECWVPEPKEPRLALAKTPLDLKVEEAWAAFLANQIKRATRLCHTMISELQVRRREGGLVLQAHGEFLLILAKCYVLSEETESLAQNYAESALYYLTDRPNRDETERLLFELNIKRGKFHLKNGSYEAACIVLGKALRAVPKDRELVRLLGQALERSGEMREAALLYNKHSEDQEFFDRREALFIRLLERGKTHFLNENFDLAYFLLDAADRIHPDNAELAFALGDVRTVFGDIQGALTYYRRVQADFLSSTSSLKDASRTLFNICLLRGQALNKQKLFPNALYFLKGACLIDSKNKAAVGLLIEVFFALGDEQEALAHYDKMVQSLPPPFTLEPEIYIKILLIKGRALYDKKDFKRAHDLIEQAYQMATSRLETILLLGDILEAQDEDETATLLYRKALLIYPDNEELKSRKSRVEEERILGPILLNFGENEAKEDFNEDVEGKEGNGELLKEGESVFKGGFGESHKKGSQSC